MAAIMAMAQQPLWVQQPWQQHMHRSNWHMSLLRTEVWQMQQMWYQRQHGWLLPQCQVQRFLCQQGSRALPGLTTKMAHMWMLLCGFACTKHDHMGGAAAQSAVDIPIDMFWRCVPEHPDIEPVLLRQWGRGCGSLQEAVGLVVDTGRTIDTWPKKWSSCVMEMRLPLLPHQCR